MTESRLPDVLSAVFRRVPKMLNGKKFPQNLPSDGGRRVDAQHAKGSSFCNCKYDKSTGTDCY